MDRKNKKIIMISLVCCGLALLLGAYFTWNRSSDSTPESKAVSQNMQPKKVESSGTLKFVAMGDMLAHDSIVAQAKTANGYDFKPYFKNMRSVYQNADVVFCNPETIATGSTFGISGYPVFNAPSEFSGDLVGGAGCNLLNLATNHVNDRHQAGIDANLENWEKQKNVLAFSGSNRSTAEQNTIKYFTKNGVKVAFLAFADYSNDKNLTDYGVNFYHDAAFVKRLMGEARANADAVVVSAHWGTEDSNAVNADQTAAAQLFADSGADVVIGTGPHVLQPLRYVTTADGRKTLVWYSIGNMLSSQLQVNELTGIIAGFTLTKQKTGGVSVSAPTAHITYMSYDWPAADKAAQKLTTRSNLQLRTLAGSGNAVVNMFGGGYTQAERESYVRSTLGTETGVIITP